MQCVRDGKKQIHYTFNFFHFKIKSGYTAYAFLTEQSDQISMHFLSLKHVSNFKSYKLQKFIVFPSQDFE